ncbi:Multiple organellar RNA editing factor 7 [Hibiscus syriacus]|uniref:Multiple organellar RNA editing factor 7 n=1 Tax=Hibiscus syriacus TaxID=106335 RepID=A0A6A3AZ29_HIBSY|nr:multiple organellar RNA editing factor 7, mitochondrial-like [Hibiscus syriacus]KAE8708727.1 Multiple organellar RNA editing factor 7 [Hibiscus syriacus]
MEPLSSVVQKLIGRRFSTYPSSTTRILSRYFSSDSGYNNSVLHESVELTRTPVLVEGCDYEHWFVVMEAPKGYPLRDEIVNTYIKTLAMALGSEEEAKKSIYSVSTKYYYAFGCKVPEDLAFKIKSLPNVKWVLPDSYLGDHGDNSYGGEPFIDGKVVSYDDKYHSGWIPTRNEDERKGTTHPERASGKQRKQ